MTVLVNNRLPEPGRFKDTTVKTYLESLLGVLSLNNSNAQTLLTKLEPLLNTRFGPNPPVDAEHGMFWLDNGNDPAWTLKLYTPDGWYDILYINVSTGIIKGGLWAVNTNGGNTINGLLEIIGLAGDDIYQLKLTASSGQTDKIFIAEQSTGADLFTIGNGGETKITGNAVVDSFSDIITLRVQGHSTQTNPLLTLETSSGTDVMTVDNSGKITAGGLRTGTFTLGVDTANSFTAAIDSGFLFVHTEGESQRVIAQFKTSGTALMNAIHSSSEYQQTTGALTGTTGLSNKVTISAHTDGKIYIENRNGSSKTINFTILG